MPPDPLTLDIYARVSRLGDTRLRPTTGQVEDCTVRVAERGAQVGEVLVDPGKSAWNPRVKRPDWDRLMKRLETGSTGGVVVFDLARFSRRPVEGERLIAAAERGLLVLDSEGEYDLTSASGKKAFRDQLSAAAYESDRLSTRVKRGKRLKALAGEPNISGRPFGFEADGVTHRQSEAEELRNLAERILAVGDARESQDDLAADLNARGVLTSYGNQWSRESLRKLLLRPSNAGHIVYDGEIVGRLPGEPILDVDTWDRMVALFASRRRGRPISDTYLCSGIAQCGLCDHPLGGRPRANMRPYDDGGVRRGYWCQPRAINGGCGRIAIDQRGMDQAVKELVVAILADPRHAAAVESAARQAADRRAVLDAEIAEIEHLAAELSGRLGRGEIRLDRYDLAVRPLDRRLDELNRERDALATPPVVALASADLAVHQSRAAWSARWDGAATPERRRLIRMALRGRRLVVMPADPTAPRAFDARRIVIVEAQASLA